MMSGGVSLMFAMDTSAVATRTRDITGVRRRRVPQEIAQLPSRHDTQSASLPPEHSARRFRARAHSCVTTVHCDVAPRHIGARRRRDAPCAGRSRPRHRLHCGGAPRRRRARRRHRHAATDTGTQWSPAERQSVDTSARPVGSSRGGMVGAAL
jgi:hypothetical protein